MKKVIDKYKVKAGKATANQDLIKKVFEELKSKQAEGLCYNSYRMAGDLSFVHIASIETPDGNNPLSTIEAFQIFTKDI